MSYRLLPDRKLFELSIIQSMNYDDNRLYSVLDTDSLSVKQMRGSIIKKEGIADVKAGFTDTFSTRRFSDGGRFFENNILILEYPLRVYFDNKKKFEFIFKDGQTLYLNDKLFAKFGFISYPDIMLMSLFRIGDNIYFRINIFGVLNFMIVTDIDGSILCVFDTYNDGAAVNQFGNKDLIAKYKFLESGLCI